MNAESETAVAVAPLVVNKQNGVKRPESGTLTGALWDIADQLSEAANAPATRKAVVEAYMASVPNANLATANTQYARWVRYHDVSAMLAEGREAAKVEAAAKREAAKAEKAAAREAEKIAKMEAKAAEKAEKAAAREAEKAAKAEALEAEKAAKAAAKAEAEAAASAQ